MSIAASLKMGGKSVVALKQKVSLLPTGCGVSWVQMAYESTWKGHDMGEFSFTRRSLSSIVRIFNSTPESLPVTYGHPDHSLGNPAPAAGWVKQMETRPGAEGLELWGEVEWTQKAAEGIRAGEYRYCSVVVDFQPVDRKTGEIAGEAMMYELGLTGSPFLPGMQAISLSRITTNKRNLAMKAPSEENDPVEESMGKNSKVKSVKVEELDLTYGADKKMNRIVASDNMTADEAEKEIELNRIVAEDGGPAVEVEVESGDDGGLMSMLAEKTGLDTGSLMKALMDNMDKLADMLVGAAEAEPVELSAHKGRALALADQVNELQKTVLELSTYRNKQLQKEKEERIEGAFNRLLGEGKVALSQKPTFLSACQKNEETALSIYDSLPAVKPPGGALVTGNAASTVPAGGLRQRGGSEESLDENDTQVKMLRLSARGQGLSGANIDNFVRRALKVKAAHTST